MYYQAPSHCSTWCSRIHLNQFSHPTHCRPLWIIVQSSLTCQQRKVARPSRTDARYLCMTRQMPDNYGCVGSHWSGLHLARKPGGGCVGLDWQLLGNLPRTCLTQTDYYKHVLKTMVQQESEVLSLLERSPVSLFSLPTPRCHGRVCVSKSSKPLCQGAARCRETLFSRLGWKLSSGNLPAKVWWRYAKKACGWSSRTGIQTLSLDGQVVTRPINKQQCWTRSILSSVLLFPLRLIRRQLVPTRLWISRNYLRGGFPRVERASWWEESRPGWCQQRSPEDCRLPGRCRISC